MLLSTLQQKQFSSENKNILNSSLLFMKTGEIARVASETTKSPNMNQTKKTSNFSAKIMTISKLVYDAEYLGHSNKRFINISIINPEYPIGGMLEVVYLNPKTMSGTLPLVHRVF